MLTERKSSQITVFHQIIRKFLTEKKLERTRIKKCFLPPLHQLFHTKFTISILKSKYVCYPNQQYSNLGCQCQSLQLESQSFMTPQILNTNFIKRELNIAYPQVLNWDPLDWEPTGITTTPCSAYSMMGSLEVLYTHLQGLGTILETLDFP